MSILPSRRRLSLLIVLVSTPALAGEAATGLDQAQAERSRLLRQGQGRYAAANQQRYIR